VAEEEEAVLEGELDVHELTGMELRGLKHQRGIGGIYKDLWGWGGDLVCAKKADGFP